MMENDQTPHSLNTMTQKLSKMGRYIGPLLRTSSEVLFIVLNTCANTQTAIANYTIFILKKTITNFIQSTIRH